MSPDIAEYLQVWGSMCKTAPGWKISDLPKWWTFSFVMKYSLNASFNDFKILRHMGFPGGSDSKESACNAGDPGSIPGSGRSPGEGHGNPLRYSCLENPTHRGAWWAMVHGVSRVWHDWATSTFTFTTYNKLIQALHIIRHFTFHHLLFHGK